MRKRSLMSERDKGREKETWEHGTQMLTSWALPGAEVFLSFSSNITTLTPTYSLPVLKDYLGLLSLTLSEISNFPECSLINCYLRTRMFFSISLCSAEYVYIVGTK